MTTVEAALQTKAEDEGDGFLQATGEALRQIGEMIKPFYPAVCW